MKTRAKLVAFSAALALLTAGAFAVGCAVGPPPAPAAPGAAEHGPAHAQVPPAATELPAGLASSRDGYPFSPVDPILAVGTPVDFRFRITGPDGAPVTAFDEQHTRRLHLIVVRRDSTGHQHLHPEMGADGTWRIPLTVPVAGDDRAFANFTPTGAAPLTLGVDLATTGDQPPARHTPARTALPDGDQVQLEGELVPGQVSPLALSVSRDGAPVTDLQPYLGAYGHLVALREGDLAYLHLHPDGGPGDGRTAAGPQIRFVAEVPSAGSYRLFLDFPHGGAIRTAEFTVPTGAPTGPGGPAAAAHGHSAEDGGHR